MLIKVILLVCGLAVFNGSPLIGVALIAIALFI